MCAVVLLLSPTNLPLEMQAHTSTAPPYPDLAAPYPIVWRSPLPPDVVEKFVSWSNPMGGTKNSYLQMAGSVFHHDGVENCFDVRECTVIHRYIPRYDFVRGVKNEISCLPSRYAHLTEA